MALSMLVMGVAPAAAVIAVRIGSSGAIVRSARCERRATRIIEERLAGRSTVMIRAPSILRRTIGLSLEARAASLRLRGGAVR
jgi:hypothetical protein